MSPAASEAFKVPEQVAIAWLFAVAVATTIYFVPAKRLVDNLSDHPTTITAAE